MASQQLQGNECRKVTVGMTVCASVSSWKDDLRYYDAAVEGNQDLADTVQKVVVAYDCRMVEGVLSHQMMQFVIDGNKVVLSVPNPKMSIDDAEFEENEVYSIDIFATTGEGKPKLLDEKQTTIYKQAMNKSYNMKMEASRFISSEIGQKLPVMPFTASLPSLSFWDCALALTGPPNVYFQNYDAISFLFCKKGSVEEKRARLGLVEFVNHELLQPYLVLHEKHEEVWRCLQGWK